MFDLMHFTKAEQDKILKSMTILVDTREHDGKNDHILSYFDSKKINWTRYKLDHGDYSCSIPANEELKIPKDLYFTNQICVERKNSLDEWAGNICEDRSAVKKKIALMPKKKVLIIENGSYADIAEHKYRSKYDPKSYLGTLHSIWNEYDIPIIFMPDKTYTGMFIASFFYYYIRGMIK